MRAVDPHIRALILTSYDDDEALFAAIMAGASGYILKEATGQDLIAAVHHVAAGHSLIDPLLIDRVLDRVRNGPATAPELAGLTEQELKLLELVAEGMTNRQIGERMFLAEKTVKNYVSTMLQKLGLERRAQAAALAARLLSENATPLIHCARGTLHEQPRPTEVTLAQLQGSAQGDGAGTHVLEPACVRRLVRHRLHRRPRSS